MRPGRRLGPVVAVAGALVAALWSVPTNIEAQVIDTENPRTGLEPSNRGLWSTEAELTTALEAASAAPHVDLAVIGTTAQGRPIHRVVVDDPDAEPDVVVAVVCSQHGDEPAPREACLRLVQQLAAGDPVLDHLRLVLIPDANPDGRAAGTRYNTESVDVNRDHLELVSPEARAIAATLREYRPHVVVDAHEYIVAIPHLYDDDIQYLWSRNLAADREVTALSRSLAEDHVSVAAEDAGYTTDTYGGVDILGEDVYQNGGGPSPTGLRESASLRHSVALLVEANANPRFTAPAEAIDDTVFTERRVDSQLVMIRSALDFAAQRRTEIMDAVSDARATAGRTAPLHIGGSDDTPPTAAEVIDPAPCGWRLDDDPAPRFDRFIAHWPVEHTTSDGGRFVPLDQEAAPVLPYVLQPGSPFGLAAAEPVAVCSPAATPGATPAAPDADAAPAGERLPATGAQPTLSGWLALAVGVSILAARRRAGSTSHPGRAPGQTGDVA